MNVRENWRIVVLVVFLLGAGLLLFGPFQGAGEGGGDAAAGPTNLEFGIDLGGGIRLRGTLVGFTADGVNLSGVDQQTLTTQIADELGVAELDVGVRPGQVPGDGTIELFNGSYSRAEFAAALGAAGIDVSADGIREGVTTETLGSAAETITGKIDQTGLAGGGATVATTAAGESFIRIQTPSTNFTQVNETISRQGQVEVVALYPNPSGSGHLRETVLVSGAGQSDFAADPQARQGEEGRPPHVSVTLTDDAAPDFMRNLQDFGFGQPGGVACDRPQSPDGNYSGYCLMTVVDGNISYAGGMEASLSESIRTGEFVESPAFILQTDSFERARQIERDLRAGALPSQFVMQSFNQVEPGTAERFKLLSLVTGLLAWIALSGVIFLRYRQTRIAIPMLLTATAEVFILLGFAVAVGMRLNLAHIAGFIAVIGTGVDDLVIITDEILQRGEIGTGRVFQSRFRKAFWVIGAAAATTIVAMSPLIGFGLGELAGFAIITIVGVLIGVLITRPAFGDVLKNLLLDRDQT
ncbi:MAG: preprotein translocase subunit SecD [Haloarculaceae archaeon]